MPDSLATVAGTTAVSFILGGGAWAAIAQLRKGWADANKTDAETETLQARRGVEVDSVVVQGAEATVLMMRSALERADAENIRLTEAAARDRARIEQLEGRIESLQETLTEAQNALTGLRAELGRFTADHDAEHDDARR